MIIQKSEYPFCGYYIYKKTPKTKKELFINLINDILSKKEYIIIALEINSESCIPDGCYIKKKRKQ
ncbi:MAG: hypothetical protein QMB51_02010 [Patescibacteria group bacterium]